LKVSLFEKILEEKIEPLKIGEQLMINVGTARTLGVVKSIKKDVMDFDLRLPVCADKKERFVLSRRILDRWRLIGWGVIK